jgi:hypothetical protein
MRNVMSVPRQLAMSSQADEGATWQLNMVRHDSELRRYQPMKLQGALHNSVVQLLKFGWLYFPSPEVFFRNSSLKEQHCMVMRLGSSSTEQKQDAESTSASNCYKKTSLKGRSEARRPLCISSCQRKCPLQICFSKTESNVSIVRSGFRKLNHIHRKSPYFFRIFYYAESSRTALSILSLSASKYNLRSYVRLIVVVTNGNYVKFRISISECIL